MTLLFLLSACKSPTPTDPVPPATVVEALDVAVRLAPGEVRAGVIADEAALFGGISAEGQIGDFKIYNDQVQFIVQGARLGSYYLELGGGVIDADVVRPEGEMGRDFVEEWNTMLGFGRVISPTAVEVVQNGSEGEAVIRVTGTDAPLSLLVGTLESDQLLQAQGLEVVTEYRLKPDSPLLEVTTTITATRDLANIAMGDILLGAPELADAWTAGGGMAGTSGEKDATGYIGARNDGAIGILALPGAKLQASASADLLADLIDLVLGFDITLPLPAGTSHTWTRYWGAGRDLAVLTDARLAGEGTRTESGTVTAPDGPVAGARVHVVANELSYTVAVTDEQGAFTADVPASAGVRFVTDAAGHGLHLDLPAGAASWAPFASPAVNSASAASIRDGAIARPYAQSRGVHEGLVVDQPGVVRIDLDDDLPYTVRIGPGVEFPDRRFASPRPSGLAAAGWSRGGPLELEVEAGTFDVLVHRGTRFDVLTQSVTVVPGQTVDITGSLTPAFQHDGYVLGDPHSHSAPSGDGQISMEERLMVHAAGGVQLHFGSDHDRVADYRPLLEALELDSMQSIVADEVSSVLRGHMNAYPLEPDPTLPNNGAVSWWTQIPASTQELVDRVRERHGDIIMQSNHPLDNGVADAADWSPGLIGDASFWVTDLNAMEVLNDGQHLDYFEVWLDLTARGYLLTPVGVSDAHGHFNGPPGINVTWIGGTPGAMTPANLKEAYRTGDVHVGLGVFLDLSERPGSTLTSATTLDVTALSPPWATVDRILLYENGVVVETVPGTTASFELDPPADTVYVVVAEGDQPMLPVSTRRPWATSNVYLFDRGGDGWSAPLPPLE